MLLRWVGTRTKHSTPDGEPLGDPLRGRSPRGAVGTGQTSIIDGRGGFVRSNVGHKCSSDSFPTPSCGGAHGESVASGDGDK